MIVELTTGVADLLAWKSPKGAFNISLKNNGYCWLLEFETIDDPENMHYVNLPCDARVWLSPVRSVREITEEQAKRIMPLYADVLYKDYTKEPEVTDNGVKVYGFQEALKSLHSLLQSKQVYTVNPYGKEPDTRDYEYEYDEYYSPDDDFQFDTFKYNMDHNRWLEAEQRVGNWFLLRKEAQK